MTDQSPQTGPASSPAGPSRGTGSGGSWAIFLGAAVVLLLMVALLFVGLSSSLRKSRELESARTELDQRAEALLKMRQDLTLQTQRVTETTGEINRLTTSLSAEREARTRDAKELTDLRAQRANLDRLRAEREKAAEDLRLATAERDELRRQAAEIAVVKSKLEEQVSALTLRLDEAMRSIRLLEERVAALTVERDELREQLRVARERVALVEAQLASGQLVPTQLVPGQAGTRPAAALSNNGLASSGPMTASGRLETLAGGRWSGLAGAGGASMIGAASSPSTSTAQPNQGGRIRLSGLFDPPPRPAASPQDQPAQPQGDLPAGVRMIEDSHATPPTGEGGNAPPSASPAANEPSSGPSAARWHGSGRATDADRSQGRQAPSGVFALTVTAQDEQVLRSASGIPEAMNDLPPSVRVVAANDHSAGWSQSPTPPATRPAIPTPTPTLTAPSEPSLTVQPTQQPADFSPMPPVRGQTLTPFRPGGLSETDELMNQAMANREALLARAERIRRGEVAPDGTLLAPRFPDLPPQAAFSSGEQLATSNPAPANEGTTGVGRNYAQKSIGVLGFVPDLIGNAFTALGEGIDSLFTGTQYSPPAAPPIQPTQADPGKP